MKKLIRSFTFWAAVLSLLTILQQQLGYDSKSIILIYFNPLLRMVSYNDTLLDFMNSGYPVPCRNLLAGDTISLYWYIGSVLTCALYGGVIDLFRAVFKKITRSGKKSMG